MEIGRPKNSPVEKKIAGFATSQCSRCRVDIWSGSREDGKITKFPCVCLSHGENDGTLGMVPLIINPIYTLYSGYLLGFMCVFIWLTESNVELV